MHSSDRKLYKKIIGSEILPRQIMEYHRRMEIYKQRLGKKISPEDYMKIIFCVFSDLERTITDPALPRPTEQWADVEYLAKVNVDWHNKIREGKFIGIADDHRLLIKVNGNIKKMQHWRVSLIEPEEQEDGRIQSVA